VRAVGAKSQQEDPSQDAASVMRAMSVEDLMRACEQGSQAACEELDHRGVEPPAVEPETVIGADNVIALERAREARYDAAARGALVDALVTEADRLGQQTIDFLVAFVRTQSGTVEERETLRRAVSCSVAAASLRASIDHLARVAELLSPAIGREYQGA
jgi:hypothetical protein